ITDDVAKHRMILQGLADAFKGLQRVDLPSDWRKVSAKLARTEDPTVRALTSSLSVQFGDPAALDAMRKSLTDVAQPVAARRAAVESLVNVHDEKLPATLRALLADADLRPSVLRAMAVYDDPLSAELIVGAYPTFSTAEKRDAISTLAARKRFAQVLLKA